MAILNAGVSVSPGPAAGPAGQASLVAVNAEGLRGLVGVRTDASGLAAGLLATVHLAQPIITDQDAYLQGQGQQNGGVFTGLEVLVTPFQPAPPAGVLFFPIAQLSQGAVPAFGIGVSGPLAANTSYRFSWRVLV